MCKNYTIEMFQVVYIQRFEGILQQNFFEVMRMLAKFKIAVASSKPKVRHKSSCYCKRMLVIFKFFARLPQTSVLV